MKAPMRTWVRVLLAVGAAILGALFATFVMAWSCDALGHDRQGDAIEGTGLVIMGLAPFTAILGAIVGVWIALRVTRKRAAAARVARDA